MKRSGGEILVECLLAEGAKIGFGVPGESYLAVLDAFFTHQDQFEFITCRNEAGACFMAEASAKLTGEVGLCFVTRGPGATNASIGVHTAAQNSTPLILFVGQVGTDMHYREAFQEIDYQSMYGSIAKWVCEIDRVDRIPELIGRAFAIARSGRPGPVVIALPEDMLTVLDSVNPHKPTHWVRPGIDETVCDQIVKSLQAASFPILLVGGGGINEEGRDGLRRFSSHFDLPVVTAFRFNDVIDNHCPQFAGEAGVGMLPGVTQSLEESDLILAVGTRFGEMTTKAYSLFTVPNAEQKIIHLHPEPCEIGKIYQVEMGICADVNAGLKALADYAQDRQLRRNPLHRDWMHGCRNRLENAMQCPPRPGTLDMKKAMLHLQNNLPEDVIITNGAGNFAIWPNKHFLYGEKARLLAPQSGAMGYGLPAAIAAKKLYPHRKVVCFAGDGDFQMNMNEMGSALQHGCQPVILLLNNAMYGTIRMHQERHYPTRISGTEIVNPDFVQLARSYGFFAEKIETNAQFESAMEAALQSKTGALLELMIDPDAITPTASIGDLNQQQG